MDDAGRDPVQAITTAIARLVAERQALRAGAAGAAELERNRLAIVRAQRRLSRALIRRFSRAAA